MPCFAGKKESMIFIKLLGGLGNQMFQYALGRHLSLIRKVPLKLDLTTLLDRTPRPNWIFRDYDLDIFNLKVEFASAEEISAFNRIYPNNQAKLFHRIELLLNGHHIRDYSPRFNPKVFRAKTDPLYLEGYWQSELYFKEIGESLRKDLEFRYPLNSECQEIAKHILSVNSVAVQFRRTDYVSMKSSRELLGSLDMEYYERAMKFIAEKIKDPYFFIFSDEEEWVRENLKTTYPHFIFPLKYSGKKFEHKFHLATLCKHHIIANSSWGWWGAWLSQHKGKIIIAPQRWLI